MSKFNLKRQMYWTMNSWNREQSLAYNLKIHKLAIPSAIKDKLYDLICYDEFYDQINNWIKDFESKTGYRAGFNGRSGGYLVLYRPEGFRGLTVDEVPVEIRKAFRKLAENIVEEAIWLAENARIETYQEVKEVKHLVWEC